MNLHPLPAIYILALLVSACSPAPEQRPAGDMPGEPTEYGPFVLLDGIYVSEFEVSSFHPCTDMQDTDVCKAAGGMGCWLVFSDEAVAQVDRHGAAFPGPEYPGEARVWGFGRIAHGPNEFGHLSAYSCQVELAHVNRFEKRPAGRLR